jgi:hypothetical protein
MSFIEQNCEKKSFNMTILIIIIVLVQKKSVVGTSGTLFYNFIFIYLLLAIEK